ncbi:MAG: hypothetical protein L0Z62_01320 [Gemmataceae bacterium]|nr:hypothetical protein [Gemmataceae bacterium]
MFDPRVGRWLSEDPVGLGGGDPNLYRYGGNNFPNVTDPSGLLEADDRENAPGNRRLVPVNDRLDAYVNSVIRPIQERYRTRVNEEIRAMRARGAQDEASVTGLLLQRGAQMVRDVYEALGEDQPRSGVDAGIAGSRAQITKIEHWLKNNLSSERNEINQVTFRQSRYRFNTIGHGVVGPHPWWFATSDERALNHGIAPTIRLRVVGHDSAVLMGTDKWGHFFQQGYWLFRLIEREREAFSRYLEGDYSPNGRPHGEEARFREHARRFESGGEGMQGSRASGVISNADIEANLRGADFYDDLYYNFLGGGGPLVFRSESRANRRFNEALHNQNTFVRGTMVDDTDRPWRPLTPAEEDRARMLSRPPPAP